MKFIDDSILEAISELVCGSGEGSGGGYDTPGPYRTKGEVISFFQRAGVWPAGQSSTRKWFTLESLQAINGTNALKGILLRLCNPKEYYRSPDMPPKVIGYLNSLLQVEGLGVELDGIEPKLRQRSPTLDVHQPPTAQTDVPPNFSQLVVDDTLAAILALRWKEAQKCVNAEAFLAAIVMMGSILEGVLLHKVESNLKVANQSRSAPKDNRRGKPRPIHDWGLSALIDVAHDVGWLQGDVRRFSHALRQSRNLVHPYMERLERDRPDKDTCSISWQVVRAAVADLLGID